MSADFLWSQFPLLNHDQMKSWLRYVIPAGWLWGEHGWLYKMGVVDIAGFSSTLKMMVARLSITSATSNSALFNATNTQRWKKRQTLQTCLCYFSQLVLIFRPRARKTMHEECFTHCIISTRAISTSAISINNAFFMLFTDFYAVLSWIFWC